MTSTIKQKEASKRYRERKKAQRLGIPVPPTLIVMDRTEEEKRTYKNKLDKKLRIDKTPEEREVYLQKERERKREANKKWKLKNPDYYKNWVDKNSDKMRLARAKHVSNNYDKVQQSKKLWRINNPEAIKESSIERYKRLKQDPELLEQHKAYRRKYEKARKAKDIKYAVRCSLRNSFYHAVVLKKKEFPTTELIGCTIEEFIKYIENQFVDGMTWTPKNFHLDHIKPCSSFDLTDPEQVKECYNYTNFQPLWPKDNLEKHAKTNWEKHDR